MSARHDEPELGRDFRNAPLDFDLYEPTKAAIETFLPRMPKGAIIAFDELNAKIFPGETKAVDDTIGLRNLRIRRFPFDSYVSYAVLE